MKLRNKKTGEAGYLELEKGDDERYIGLRVYKNDFMYKRYNSLAELNAEWEDYEPPMLKIKSEKICKIVRDWYEYHDTNLPIYREDACTLSIDHTARIEFWDRVFADLNEYKPYTIEELCGDEK